jgi:predicted TPR repeat methyltransferase
MTPVLRSSGNLSADRRYDYARGAAAEGDHAAAADLLQQTLEIVPTWAPAWFALGEAREELGERDLAAQAFAQALACEPDDSQGARLRLARLGALDQPAQPPQAYVRDLFDQYAARFETHLVKDLGYRAPSVLREAIARVARNKRFAHALDLGCGTGLMAREMADLCDHIEGVDLAPAMSAKARASGLYANVDAGDLLDWLRARGDKSADLVMAADVFVYCGDLDAIFGEVARVASSAAIFAFTLQKAGGADYRLGEDLRYAHAPAYVERLAATYGFALQVCEDVSVRQDRGQPVSGLVVVLATL